MIDTLNLGQYGLDGGERAIIYEGEVPADAYLVAHPDALCDLEGWR